MSQTPEMSYEQATRLQRLDKEAKAAVLNFVDVVNGASNQDFKKALVKHMVNEHRTHQQTMMRFFMAFVEGMAENGCDGRNQESVALAKKIMEIEDRHLPYV